MTKAARGSISASELMSKLARDRDWVAADNDRRAALDEAKARYRAEEQPLLADLKEAGWPVASVYDLVNGAAAYSSAIPVLINHLQRPYSDRITEGIARALTVREARGKAGGALAEAMRVSSGRDAACRWAMANALVAVAGRDDQTPLQVLLSAESDSAVGERLELALRRAKRR